MTASPVSVTEHTAKSGAHTTFYLAAGPENGPLILFVHGWPELSISWRHQLPVLGGLGFRAVAPDLRGYGRSSIYDRQGDYAQERIVADMIGLLDALGRETAVWVGHDWGSVVVWNIASHHPERCRAVASLCVPYYTLERGLDAVIPLVDRDVYPEDEYPAGQWEYQVYYQENFGRAQQVFEADCYNTVKALFRKGDPAGRLKPVFTAGTRIDGGWFGGLDAAPDFPRDDDVVSEQELRVYAAALERNGFFGPNAIYMNHEANAEYAGRALNGGHLDMPVLFLAAAYDYVCESMTSQLAEPMPRYCRNLSRYTVQAGHWMAQEKPIDVNAALVGWLAGSIGDFWPWPPLDMSGQTR